MPAQAAAHPHPPALTMTGQLEPFVENEPEPAPIPWRRVFGLLHPLRRGVAGMVGLTVSGVLIGLVPPLLLGVLINALVEHNDKPEAALLAGFVAVAVLLEASAYVASDGVYARNASRLYRNLRVRMFAGALHGARRNAGVSARFISDAETIERITLSIIDRGAMQSVEFISALVTLAILEPATVAVVLPSLGATWLIARRVQRPAATAALRRQEAFEEMTSTISHELGSSSHGYACGQFRSVAERLMAAEVRLGWLRAVNLQGSGGLARLGPITAVVAAAFIGSHHAGTLMAIYLLAQRVFWGFDGLVDLRLDSESARGAVARCFELIDAPEEPVVTTAWVESRQPVGAAGAPLTAGP